MKRIALLTPLHPLKTGIADYIEEMLPYIRHSLNDEYKIDIFVDGYTPANADTIQHHDIYQMNLFESMRENYCLIIYQMGNNNYHLKILSLALKYPGLVVMHDFAIHHLMAYYYLESKKSDTAYFQAVEDNHGKDARNIAFQRAVNGELGLWETDAIDYPMNRTLVENSKGVIVFSEYAKKRLLEYGTHVPIYRVFLHCSGIARNITSKEKKEAQKRLGVSLSDDESLICVFGFIGKAKRPYSILEAAGRLKAMGFRFKLVFVGQLQDDCKDFPNIIKRKGLKNNISITGFTSASVFDDYVCAADICISLRYPTMGENSGVLMRALRYGKPSVVTDIGAFKEFPDDTVIKINYGDEEVDELTKALSEMLTNSDVCDSLSRNAVEFAKMNLEPQTTADSFVRFVENLILFDQIKAQSEYQAACEKYLDSYKQADKKEDSLLRDAAHQLASSFINN